MKEFSSLFKEKIAGFLEYRTARGFKSETYIRHLLRFDRWCTEKHAGESAFSRELVHGWLDEDAAYSCDAISRAAAVRQFGRYLCSLGEDAYILPEKYSPARSRAAAHIFTDSELSALFASIDRLPPTEKEPFLNETVPVMFRLIYSCGLRPNEGRGLLTENIRLDTGEVLITHTKRNKERLVAMSDSMADLARRYEQRRRIFGSGNPYFFPSAGGAALEAGTVCSAFNSAWSRANLTDKYPGRVRVYDLRHRFASERLIRWLDDGENLMAMLPFLREYMGHKTLAETAYYVHVLPENLAKSPTIDWDKFNAMFPEVDI